MELSFEVLELRTRHSFHISRMAAPATRSSVWIRIRDGDGLEGWGEAAVSTPYYGETAETAEAVLVRFAEVLRQLAAGESTELERLESILDRAIGHNAATKAGISGALHDLHGKRLGAPLWKVWGLSPAAAPRSSFTIGIDEIEVMREKVREAAGYPILKIKVGTDRDEEILRMLRQEAPEKTIYVDANTAWTAAAAISMLPMLQEYGVALVEQPVHPDDLEGMRRVRDESPIPIIADESCRTLADVPRLAGVVDGINIKLAKCGSLREAQRMIHCARAHRMSVMLGCMLETTLGIAAAVQLAPLVDYTDLDGSALLAEDPFRGPGLEADGRLRFNPEPGLGVARNFEF